MFLFIIYSFISAQTIVVEAPSEMPNAPLLSTASSKASSEDSLFEIPNVNVAGGTNRARYLQIRGLGETSVYETTPSHSVSFWIDDIDVSGLLATWPQQNVKSLNVQAGPQSMDYGGLASAGIFKMELHEVKTPSLQFLTSSVGEYQVGIQTHPLPRSDFFLSHRQNKGFYENTFTHKAGAQQNEVASSWKQIWKSSATTPIHSSHILQNNQNLYDVWNLNNSYVTQSDRQGEDKLFLHGHVLEIEHHFTSNLSASSLTSFTEGTSLYSYDADWSHQPDYDYFDSQTRVRRQWHQKNFLHTQYFSLGTHIYGLNEKSDIKNYKKGLIKNFLLSDFTNVNAALILQKHWSYLKNEITAQTRQEWQHLKYYDSNDIEQKKSLRAQAYALQFKKPWSETSSWSLRWSQGFKNPGFNVDPDLSSSQQYYGLETTQSYEVALLTPSHRWTLFYQKQNNSQLKISQQVDPSDPSTFFYYTTASGKTDGWGLEYLGRWTWARWSGESQVGFLQTQFRDYSFEGVNYRHRELAHAPRWNFTTSVRYDWSSQWTSIVSLNGRDAFYYSNNHNQKSMPSTLLNLGLLYQKQNWDLAFWIKNVTNERTTLRGFYFANEPPDWPLKLYEQLGAPRHFLLTSNYRF